MRWCKCFFVTSVAHNFSLWGIWLHPWHVILSNSLLRCHYSPKLRAVLVNRVIPVVILYKGMGYSLDSMGFTSLFEEAGGGVTITKLLKGYLNRACMVCLKRLFTGSVYRVCLHVLFTGFVYSVCSQSLFTESVYRVCLQGLFTGSVDSLFTGSVHRVCLKVFSQVLFTGFLTGSLHRAPYQLPAGLSSRSPQLSIITSEPFVQPQLIPPATCHQVTEVLRNGEKACFNMFYHIDQQGSKRQTSCKTSNV